MVKRIYTLEEIGEIKINLEDVSRRKNGEEYFYATYKPQDVIVKECSGCGKIKQINIIKSTTRLVGKSIEKFYLLCESCEGAEWI